MRTNLLVALGCALILSGCAGVTMIDSMPSGADVYVDGVRVGQTPVRYEDMAVSLTSHSVRIAKDGYKPVNEQFARQGRANMSAIVGGIFIWPVWLWALDYPASLTYELQPESGSGTPMPDRE